MNAGRDEYEVDNNVVRAREGYVTSEGAYRVLVESVCMDVRCSCWLKYDPCMARSSMTQDKLHHSPVKVVQPRQNRAKVIIGT